MGQAASVAEAAERLREDFALLDEYRDKVEHLIDLGKRLPPLPDALKTEGNKVRGCQSQVWLVAELDPSRGRLRLLYDSRTPAEVLANPPAVLEEIGLARFLTPDRASGLHAMVARIRALAEAYA